MRARLTYGRGPQLLAAFFLAVLSVATVLAIVRPGAGNGAAGAGRSFRPDFAGLQQKGTMLGDPHAPATLVEFADLQCPFCARFAVDALPGVVRDWVQPGRLRLDLRLMSFIGPDSARAARLADAAALQNRIWPFAELFYLNQGTENSGYVTPLFLRGIATATPGLDVAKALRARNSSTVAAELRSARDSARKLGVKSTPSFFLLRRGRPPVRIQPAALTARAMSSALEAAL